MTANWRIAAFFLSLVWALMEPSGVQARNAWLESDLRRFSDLSVFYQAMIATGVADELRPDEHYTVLAPTNTAFAKYLNQASYPCFYRSECKDLAAEIVRAHIIEGKVSLETMVKSARFETEGKQWVHVLEPVRNEYIVNQSSVLSVGDVDENFIYRLGGLVVPERNLDIFAPADVEAGRASDVASEQDGPLSPDSQPAPSLEATVRRANASRPFGFASVIKVNAPIITSWQ